MTSFFCQILFSCALAVPGAKSVDELTFGTALYDYYQQDYEQALLDVMVAERQGRTGDDPLRFELAKGSFAFEEGMYRFATETFDGVADHELSDLDRMRLAFHLSREYYRRGDWADMERELQSIDLGATWLGRQRRHPEVTFMRAEAAVARGDLPAAETALASLPPGNAYRAYGLFNLGVAYRNAGDQGAAHQTFSRLAELKVDSPEGWDLVQRGRLALALMARQSGDALNARSLLGSLPGQGRYRDLALAAYGRLAMQQDDQELAARIWLTLLKQPGWSTSHAVAELGLPMSLEKLASTAQALDRYRAAEQAFSQRLTFLQDASAQARDPVWVDELLGAFADPDDEARARALAALDNGLGTATWLEWLSGEDVHQIMVEWRELTGMAAWLERLPAQIGAYEEITDERRRRTAEARARLDAGALPGQRDELARRVASLQEDLSALARQPASPDPDWMLRLATDDEREVVDKLADMAALLAEHGSDADRSRLEPRVSRLRGVLFWQIADQKAARVRSLEKRLDESRALLADVDQRIARLGRAEESFATGVETDFRVLESRAVQMTGRVTAALEGRRQAIAQALERDVDHEMARTRQYLLTARVAVARATDQLAAAPAAAPENGS